MRISDWSSDVCSSDLRGLDLGRLAVVELLQFELQFGEQIKLVLRVADHHAHAAAARGLRGERTQVQTDDDRVEPVTDGSFDGIHGGRFGERARTLRQTDATAYRGRRPHASRSEEHT